MVARGGQRGAKKRSKQASARGREGLLAKYRALAARHAALVTRVSGGALDRALTTRLALEALRSPHLGLALLDADGQVVQRNARWAALAARGSRRWRASFGGRAREYGDLSSVAAAVAEEARASGELVVRIEHGRELVLDLRAHGGADGPVLVVALDATGEASLEREIARSRAAAVALERRRLVGDVAAGLAAEMEELLAVAEKQARLVEAAPVLAAEHRAAARAATSAVTAALERVRRLAEMAEPRETAAASSLATAVAEALALVRPRLERRGVALVVEADVAPDLPRVRAPPSRLREALVDLLLGCGETLGGGEVLSVRARRAGAWLLVEIRREGEEERDGGDRRGGAAAVGGGLVAEHLAARVGGYLMTSEGTAAGGYTLTLPVESGGTADARAPEG